MLQEYSANLPEPHPARHNPRPAGVPLPGGATEAVIAAMRSAPQVLWSESQLVWRTKKSRAAVTWAIQRLKHWGWLERGSGGKHVGHARWRLRPEFRRQP